MVRVNTKDGKFIILNSTVREVSNQIARAYVIVGGLPAFLEVDDTIIIFNQIVSISNYKEEPKQEEELDLFNWKTNAMEQRFLEHGH